MLTREIQDLVALRLNSFPAVALLGPRQVGKTTLAKTFSHLYYDLEQEEDRLKLDIQWGDIIDSEALIILDEAQEFPEIFSRLRGAIDRDRKRLGRFLILGSVSPALSRDISESLAGRIAICELSPISVGEVAKQDDDNLWLKGGYPDGGILGGIDFPVWQQSYLELLAMRDLPRWGLSAKPQITNRLFKMLSVCHGQLWNANQLGKSLGLSYHTVNTYIDQLERAYLIRRLEPYHTNLKKRLVKSPKVLWRDSGLLHALLNVSDMELLLVQPWVGASFEGWVIEQIIVFLKNRGIPIDGPYFFRTSDGYEVDLVLEVQSVMYAIEVKLSSNPGMGDMQRLKKAASLIGAKNRVLLSRTSEHVENDSVISTNLRGFLTHLDQQI